MESSGASFNTRRLLFIRIFLNAFINTLRFVFSLCKIILIHPKDILSMRNKIILAMAAAGMMYGASVYAVDPPTAGPFGSGKITFTGTITNSPVISHRATIRSPFRLDRFLTVN